VAGVTAGHDTATVKAFSGENGQTNSDAGFPSNQFATVNLRLIPKRGIVRGLDAAVWVRIRDDP
jgi:hypothetical protein